ncbi:MAG: tetratricopeptide repeat protein, partial [Myxococcales bacterium]|nr:tetratricopeptide repeat protein [Myxococcales bacterium]
SAFGSLDLGFGSSDDIALDSTMAGVGGPDMGPNLDLPDLPDPEEMTRDGRAGAGGVSFGELDLGDGPSEPTPGMELDLPLEAPPEEPTGHAAPTAVDGDALQIDEGAIEASRVAIEADKQKRTVAARAAGATGAPRQSRRDLRKVFAVIGVMTVVVVVAGGYFLSYTPYGLFGQYALERYTGAIGTPAAAQKALKVAERALTLDTLPDSRRAARIMSNARQAAGVNRSLLVNSVAIEALHLQRFDDKKFGGEERISKLMDRIEKRQRDTPHLPLAAAGEKLVKRDFKGALASAKAEKSLLGYLLQAEALIALKRPADAQKAFELAKKAGGGAWAEWGIARTLMDGESPEALEAAVDATLAASPNHAEARVEKARLLRAAGKLDEAMALLVEVTASDKKKNKLGASMRTQSAAWTVIGSLFELERNRTKARAAYEKATALDSDNAEALVASGRVMLLDNRPEDALAQFDMVMRAGDDVPLHAKDARPLSAEAKLGAVEALIELQREQEALAIVSELTKQRPQDPVVMLWLGKTEAAANDLANAETHYREAISLDKTSFIGYMALAELFFEKNEPEKAAVVLEQATKEVSDNVEVQRMLGESELQRNHIPEAIARFQQALAISPNDTDTLFSLGVAQRRGGFLDDAATTLDRVMKLDSSWPGLATERGRVFEAQGQSEAAVKMYSDALVDTPEDIDLKLRLGAAQVLAGRMDEAEKILLEVNSLMARSGEAEHFLGRVAFARGDLESASARFKRAIDLDPERGVYYAYYAWAELERGNLGMVQTQLNRAIELDPSYAESYWIRGRLELRTGAVKDALKDLKKAVGLKPTLYEAFANIAEAQSQLRHVPDAMAAYKTALAGKPRRGDWWLELGKLYLNSDHRPDASRAFATAVELGEDHLRKQQQMPIWLPDALRWRAEAARL